MKSYWQFLISASVVVSAGTILVKASDAIASLTGLGRLLVGGILLAGATSLPEILVDINAVRKGMPNLAIGDLMGSSLANLFILAIADTMHHSSSRLFSRASATHALSGALSINMTAMAGIAIFLGPHIKTWEVGGIGLGTIAVGVSYLLGLRLVYLDQRLVPPPGGRETVMTQNSDANKGALAKAAAAFAISTIAILLAAPFLTEAAGEIAKQTGLGGTFVGSTLLAFSTSLPELVSTITAVRMGAFELAVGNIFGSNSVNMLILLPLDWAHDGPLLASVSPSHVLTALAVILATSVAIMGQLYRVERRKFLMEPDAFAIMGIVTGALYLLYSLGPGGT